MDRRFKVQIQDMIFLVVDEFAALKFLWIRKNLMNQY